MQPHSDRAKQAEGADASPRAMGSFIGAECAEPPSSSLIERFTRLFYALHGIVRITPESGHVQRQFQCPLSATSGHRCLFPPSQN